MFILGENKKYIAAIFNILVVNKNILAENNLFLRSVKRFSAKRERLRRAKGSFNRACGACQVHRRQRLD